MTPDLTVRCRKCGHPLAAVGHACSVSANAMADAVVTAGDLYQAVKSELLLNHPETWLVLSRREAELTPKPSPSPAVDAWAAECEAEERDAQDALDALDALDGERDATEGP